MAKATPTTTRLMTNVNNLDAIVQESSSPDSPDQTEPKRPGWFRRWWWLVLLLVVLAVIAAVVIRSMIVQVDYVIESPGNLYTTGDRISVQGAQTYPTDDKIDLVTVTLDTRVSEFEKFVAEHNGDDIIVPAKDVLGGQTPAQNDQLNSLLMSQSKDAAVLVALQRLGYDVHPTQTGAIVQETVPGSPADGVVRVADTIVAIDGTPIVSTDNVRTQFATKKPGDTVTLTLEATDHTQRPVQVTLAENPETAGKAFLGVSMTDRLVYPDLPVQVDITSGGIGGPSAGLAYTLGILDDMTPGDLTGGEEGGRAGAHQRGGHGGRD